jgi:5,10-methylenetetrahydrofolate reductase
VSTSRPASGPVGRPVGRLERILRAGHFSVTAEVVPPRSSDAETVRAQARELVGYADAVNVTDNPAASAHMSPLAGIALVAASGIEPTAQLTVRDRNRLALTSELLGAWTLGARNVLCLSGDPVGVGDHPDATEVKDLSALDLVRLAATLRSEGRILSGAEIEDPPRYFVGVADAPLAERYEVARLEAKVDAGAGFVMTQIAYDVDAMRVWVEIARSRGILERAFLIAGVAPLRSARSARFLDEHLPGVRVPGEVLSALDDAGPGGEGEVGLSITADVIRQLREIEGIAGVHVMGLGSQRTVAKVVEDAGLLPRPGSV